MLNAVMLRETLAIKWRSWCESERWDHLRSSFFALLFHNSVAWPQFDRTWCRSLKHSSYRLIQIGPLYVVNDNWFEIVAVLFNYILFFFSLAQVVVGLMGLLANIVCMAIIKVVGKRKLIFFSLIGTGTSCFALGKFIFHYFTDVFPVNL